MYLSLLTYVYGYLPRYIGSYKFKQITAQAVAVEERIHVCKVHYEVHIK